MQDSLTSNAYNLIIGTGINSVLGFLFWMVATRLFSTASIGFASALISAAGLLAILSELGLGIGLIRFLPGAADHRKDMINSSFTLSTLASCTICVVFLGGLDVWSPGLLALRTSYAVVLAFFIYTILVTIQPLLANTFLANRKTRFFVYTNSINAVLRILFILLFAVWFNTAEGIFLTFVISLGIALIVGMTFLMKIETDFRPQFTIKIPVLRPILTYSFGNYIGRMLFNVNTFLLPLLVINLLGAESTAYFYIAWSFVLIANIVPASVCNSLFSESSNDERLLSSNITRSLRMMGYLLVPVIIVVLVFAELILGLYGRSYSANSAIVLRLMILSTIPWGINYLYISLERIKKTIGGMLIVAASSSLLSLGLSYWLMVDHGLSGVACGYLAGQAIVAGGVLLGMGARRELNRRKQSGGYGS